jgi:DNA-directed RNA polymerase subunit E'/Rpb7
MDPLFERRQLTKSVHITSRFLQKNIQASLLSQLRMNYEGRCISEGFIQSNSITITNYTVGRTNYIRGGVDFDVTFQADVCMPHAGQRFKAPVKLRSKVGIHAKTPPIEVLIPRDLHLGNEEFETIKIDEEIEFEVVGSQYKQDDDMIVVVGRLLTKVPLPVEAPLTVAEDAREVLVSSNDSIPKSEEEGEKRVVITADDKPKKRRLKKPSEGGGSDQLSFDTVLNVNV